MNSLEQAGLWDDSAPTTWSYSPPFELSTLASDSRTSPRMLPATETDAHETLLQSLREVLHFWEQGYYDGVGTAENNAFSRLERDYSVYLNDIYPDYPLD